ncbi:glycosyltransferase [Roseivirga sp.]|uniref:glycosyltransferase n=1 Tax=Roseivirga sp. TaxID=1964215 RepID=UPI003B5199E0
MALIVFGMSPILIVFLVLLIIQVGFFSILGGKILAQRNTSNKENNQPGVSVIIAARNESKHLDTLLEKLVKQDYVDFEVIIANDRSEDNSQDILERWSKKYTNIRYIQIEELTDGWTGKKHALYRAINIAQKEILLLTDADCLPRSSRWISHMVKPFQSDNDIVLGYSPYLKTKGWLNRFVQFETLWVALQYLGFSSIGKAYMGVGRNMAIRRSSYDLDYLESIKDLEGGDDDLMISHLATKCRITTQLHPDSYTLSHAKKTLKSYFKQKIRHLAVGKRYRKKDQTLLGIFTLSYVVGWGLLIYLLISGANLKLVLVFFGIRSLIVYFILNRLGRKLSTDIEFWALPFLDLCYCFYYPLVATKALATKQVEWK